VDEVSFCQGAHMSLRLAFSPLILCLAVPAFAEDPAPIESMAEVKAGEKAQLDLQSIRRYGEVQGRFEVVVASSDAEVERAEGAAMRRLRYMANCEEGTMTLAAVGVFDTSGNVLKSLVAPPGSLDPVKPEKGSEAAKWLRRVCMF
jgi:hypothetical protein